MSKKWKHFLVVLAVLLFLPLSASKASAQPYMTVIVPKGKTVSLGMLNGSFRLQKSTWKTSNKSVATVNSYGVIKGKKNGIVTITGTVGGKKKTIKVVVAPQLKKVTLNKKSITLVKGKSYTLKGKLHPAGAKAATYWKSSDPSVASVSSGGVVKAKKVGKSVITFVAGSKKATCTVTVKAKSAKKYKFSGTVTDSVDGKVLPKATLRFRKGHNKKSGSIYVSTTSKSNGSYSVNLAQGKYTIQISKKYYVTTYVNITCYTNVTRNYAPTSISKPVENGRYRVVLTWGATPADLDSHLTGPSGNGGRFHIYYPSSYKSAYDRYGRRIAYLDVDDRSSYGPETVTIYFDVAPSGTYRYYVHDYTNRSYSYSTALGNSGARVIVYKGSKQLAAYYVPRKAGTKWHVFDIVNGRLVKKNTMGYESYPSNIK